MALLGHIAIGASLGRHLARDRDAKQTAVSVVCLAAAALLPDLDFVGVLLGVPLESPLGHRGASHSLCVAALAGLVVARFASWRLGAYVAAATASHGLIDMLTNCPVGVSLFWPFSSSRFLADLRPVPPIPTGEDFLSEALVTALGLELALFWPLLLYVMWPHLRSRRVPRTRRPTIQTDDVRDRR